MIGVRRGVGRGCGRWRNRAVALAAGLGSAVALAQSSAEGVWTASLGTDYAVGYYGASTATRIWSHALGMRYEHGAWLARLTVPYLSVDGPARVVGDGVGGVASPVATARQTQSGPGDVVAAVSYALALPQGEGWLLDVTGKIKFATADAAKGLGTGARDSTVQLDVARGLGPWSLFGSAGWRYMGDPAWADFRNPWIFSAGFSRALGAATRLGVAMDYRQRLLPDAAPLAELSVFGSYRLDARHRLQAYVVRGLANGSPQWAVGGTLSLSF